MKVKKAFTALMLVCLVLLVLPTVARAEEVASGSCSDTVTWTLSDDGTLTVSGTGPIPDNVREWADYEAQIKHVVVQEGITAVGRANFSYHSVLESVELASTVTSLGNSAFDNCMALKQINIPAGVTEIPGGAFSFCEALPSIVLPEGLRAIGAEAFMQCLSLEEIQIPQSVTTIGHHAFSICQSLETVTVPSGVTELDLGVFASNINLKEAVILGPITALPDNAFYNCWELQHVQLPDTLTSIGSECFYRCEKLTGITLPANLSALENYAFSRCESLSSVVFCGDPPTWGSNVFNACTLTAFYPAGNSDWTASVMGDQGGTVTWKAYTPGQELILASGKCGAGLNWTLDLDCTLTISGTGAMYDWDAEESVPWYAHRGQIRKVVAESGVTTLGDYAFHGCDVLSQVQLPDTLTQIGSFAFWTCYELKVLDLPESITTLKESALGCTGVEHFTIPSRIRTLEYDVLCGNDCMTSITLPEGLTTVGRSAFSGCEALTRITLPDSVKTVDAYAFSYCTGLVEVNMPDGITFGEYAFSGCIALREKYDSMRTELMLDTAVAGCVEIPDLYAFHYTFTPAVTEKYTFRTQGSSDTYGIIADADGNVLAEDDDSGEGTNCAVSAVLEAGKTYLFNVEMSGSCEVGDFTARVSVAHVYTDTVTKAATCTASGVRTWKCGYCADSYTETIPAGHSYSGGRCTVCGKTESYPMVKRNPQTMFSTLSIAKSSNYNDNFYGFYGYAANTVKSVLAEENGGYLRVEYTGGKLQVEWYTRDFTLYSRKTLNLELPIYGGVYICEDYNFVVTGQTNYEENNNKEVILVTCYDKNWNRLGAASLKGANTTVPFDAGSLRMARCEDILYVRTCHEMFTTDDGLNHQANVTISIRISDMSIVDALYGISNNNWGYVSHSFNQFIRVDGADLLAMDHGDAHPRGIMIFRNAGTAGKGDFYSSIEKVEVLTIATNTGHYNYTGVSAGGFEYSDTHYLVAGNTCPQTGGINQGNAQRNIFVTATDKNNFTKDGTKIYYLTNYTSGVTLSPPHLVKMDGNRFCLLWSADGTIYYCLLNGQGQRTSGIIKGGSGYLSDCQPIWSEGRIVWYAGTGGNPVFYQICIDAAAVSTHTHSLSNIIETMPTQNGTGILVVQCSKCDFSYRITLPAFSSGQYTFQSDTQPTCTRDGVLSYLWHSTAYGELTIKKITPALGHDYFLAEGTTYTCARCGDSFTLGQDEYMTENIRRISGTDRCLTALNVAEALKEPLGIEKFETIIIANGINFADALSGSYLAAVKNAPILLYHPASVDKNQVYIQNNLAEGGTVYILGGKSAIPEKVEAGLSGCTIRRLSGATRFETNLEILKEAGVGDREILVATGENFADSLSASATGLPILLVHNATNNLTQGQKEFLSTLSGNPITIVGGENAVGSDIAELLAAYGGVSRVSGANRHDTSVLLARRYFPESRRILLAYSMNYPDGLCGGPLGYALGAPLVLTAAGGEAPAADYVQTNAITEGVILGGRAALSEETAALVFHLYEEPEEEGPGEETPDEELTDEASPGEETSGEEADTVGAPIGEATEETICAEAASAEEESDAQTAPA